MTMDDGNSCLGDDDYEQADISSGYQHHQHQEPEAEPEAEAETATPVAAAASVLASTSTTNSNSNGYLGKHRMAASLSILQLQIQSTQEELDQLESAGGCSAVCPELVATVESTPDPLLPSVRGPTNESWDRWFRGSHHNSSRRRWI